MSRLLVRGIRVMAVAGLVFGLICLTPKTAKAYVTSFDSAWGWISAQNYSTSAQLDTAYAGQGGAAITSVTADSTSGSISLPISAEVWIGRKSRWQMGIWNMHVSISGTNKGADFWGNFWYPRREWSTPIWSGDRLLYYANIFIGQANFDVSDLASGGYQLILRTDGALSSPTMFTSEPWYAITNIWINNPWHIDGQSYVGATGRESGANSNAKARRQGNNALTVQPGKTLSFDHHLRNVDRSTMETDLTINVDRLELSLDTGKQLSFKTNPTALRGRGGPYQTFFSNRPEVKVTQDQVGRKICQRVAWLPYSWNQGGWNLSNYACANVPYHYSSGVRPNSSSESQTVSVGGSVKFNYNLSNTGPTKTRPLTYRSYTFILKAGQKLPGNSGTAAAYAKDWGKNGVGCYGRGVGGTTISRCQAGPTAGSSIVVGAGQVSRLSSASYTIDGSWLANPGDKICSYLAVDKWQVNNGVEVNSYIASNIACADVGKRPQIQINGSDSYAGGGFAGAAYPSNPVLPGAKNRGSYSQYSLLSGTGTTVNYGSAGYTVVSSGQSCQLSFANIATAVGSCGNTNAISAAKLVKRLSWPTIGSTPRAITSPLNLAAITKSGDYRYTGGGDLQVYGTLPSGVHSTIYSNKSIRIIGNIGAAETVRYNDLVSIPSLTIVSDGDVNVDAGVSFITGNFIAKSGRFVSCFGSAKADWGVIGKCRNKLKINGSVIAKIGLQLRRTFGAGNINAVNQWNNNNITTTSEWFNYAPSVWLVPYVNNQGGLQSYAIKDLTERPARY